MLTARCSAGLTPRAWAAETGHHDLARLLARLAKNPVHRRPFLSSFGEDELSRLLVWR